MKRRLPDLVASVTILLLPLAATSVRAETAGTLIFAPRGVQIIDAGGSFRDAKKGDVLQPGERLLTPAGVISQVKLPDGSLVGMRPGSVLKFEPVSSGSPTSQQVLSLVQGSVRVVGGDLAGQIRAAPVALQSGQTTLQLKGADSETALVRPPTGGGAGSSNAGPAPGSYTRLLAGSGSIQNGGATEPLPVGLVSYVAPNSAAPAALANVAAGVFAPANPATLPPGSPAQVVQAAPGQPAGALQRSTSTLTAPPRAGQTGGGVSSAPGAVKPPMFSPITTTLFPAAPNAGGQPGQPAQPGVQPRPVAGVIQQMGPIVNIRPPPPPPPKPPICRPNPQPGLPPICS